jgi:lysophospholipase L1-like esterase
MHSRRQFLLAVGGSAIGASLAFSQDASAHLQWTDAELMPIEGRGWEEQRRLRFFDRFPAKAEKTVRAAVWNLSRDSAGMAIRFRSDATSISVRYTLRSDRLAMPHMPATGVSGIDLYARDDEGRWRWVNVTRPTSKTVEGKLGDGLDAGTREYMAYLPLYNGIDALQFGVPARSLFEPLPQRARPMVFYGTSITHGACASRPGMCHPSILGRWLDRPVLNLGFSGNGRLEIEVADLMSELDASVFIVDCLPNLSNPQDVADRTAPLVRRLRTANKTTPIVLVEDRTYDYSWIKQSARDRHAATRGALRKAYEALRAAGDANLHYLEGGTLLGDDGDATTDGSHPNDLGFYRQARAMEPLLRKVLS